jgi:Holliday junction resolvase-like predicted endonuclease
MALHSIMDEKVVRWYKSQGFEILSEQEDMDTGEIKSYFMMKRIA